MSQKTPSVSDVKSYWQSHPLYSYELSEAGSNQFFEELDAIKRNDVEKFALSFWEFDRFKGLSVLDVGCGPGWFAVQYAQGGADVIAVDLTPAAVALATKYLRFRNLHA